MTTLTQTYRMQLEFIDDRRLKVGGIRFLSPQSFVLLIILSLLPGMASALTFEILNINRPDLIIPLVLALEIPFAIWVSGFMGAEDRQTIKHTFTTILSHDFSHTGPEDVMKTIFWGENSVVFFIFRIWVAVVAGILVTVIFGQIEPVLALRFDMPGYLILIISFSMFSYIFIRNLCEETIRDQLGHAILTCTFSAFIFACVYYLT
jgi:hypothetical protein